MDGVGEVSVQSPKGATFGEDDPMKYLIPLTRTGHRNTSPSRQKVIKTRPRGFDEETITTFTKVIHADVQMEDSIWAMLPEDLLTEVLARVPPFLIFRLRSVCRRWNSILHDTSFLKSHSNVPSHGPCLLASWKNSQSHQCSVFSLPLKTWYKIPFSFLPDWAFWLVGSSGGLVCFSGFDGLTFKTLVCNPLAQTWRVLPSMHYNQQRQLIMVVNRANHSFKVIAASDIYGDKTLPTEVYDSKLNSWSLHQIMPAVNLCSSKMAFCDERLYLETLSPLGLMMYRMDKGQWEHIPAKFPRSLLDGYLVAGAHKRLFLVGRIGLYSTLQSMRIWELDHAKTVWAEISRMPPKYFRALLRLSAERFECFGQDNLICFTSWNQGKGLLYDVDKKVWSWIAGCALQLCNSQDFGVPTIVIGETSVPNAINWDELLEASDRAGPANPVEQNITQDDLCALPYSSGTTGTSKGVMLTHRNIISNLCSSLFSFGEEMMGQVTTLGLMPFFHIYGITGICCAALRTKGKVVVMGRFDLRSYLEALIVHEVTFAPIVPAIILAMVKSPLVDEFDLGKLKLQSVLTAAAPLAPELRTAFEEKYPDVVIQEAYGLTEHSCITLTHGDPRKGQRVAKRNSVGFILPNLEVKFIDPETGRSLRKNTPGEICVRSQCVMHGYYKNKEETANTVDAEGWLHTGDIGYIDDDGDVFIVDRIKELIKYKGFQVAPAELEALLLSHPSVDDVAVFGLPDEDAGEIPAACIVMNKSAKESEEDIMNYVASNVASYKRVRVVQFVDSIPKSASGKIMRRFLRENAARQAKTSGGI